MTNKPIVYCDDLIEEWIKSPLYHHIHNLQETASGYGSRLTTQWKVRIGKRWFRVYLRIFSNIGSTYICRRGHQYVSTSCPEEGLTELGRKNADR
jgi:hypothetical protein